MAAVLTAEPGAGCSAVQRIPRAHTMASDQAIATAIQPTSARRSASSARRQSTCAARTATTPPETQKAAATRAARTSGRRGGSVAGLGGDATRQVLRRARMRSNGKCTHCPDLTRFRALCRSALRPGRYSVGLRGAAGWPTLPRAAGAAGPSRMPAGLSPRAGVVVVGKKDGRWYGHESRVRRHPAVRLPVSGRYVVFECRGDRGAGGHGPVDGAPPGLESGAQEAAPHQPGDPALRRRRNGPLHRARLAPAVQAAGRPPPHGAPAQPQGDAGGRGGARGRHRQPAAHRPEDRPRGLRPRRRAGPSAPVLRRHRPVVPHRPAGPQGDRARAGRAKPGAAGLEQHHRRSAVAGRPRGVRGRQAGHRPSLARRGGQVARHAGRHSSRLS